MLRFVAGRAALMRLEAASFARCAGGRPGLRFSARGRPALLLSAAGPGGAEVRWLTCVPKFQVAVILTAT